MTTLGSWIDDEALTQVIRELCPEAVLDDVPLPSSAAAVPAEEPTAAAPTVDDDEDESVPLESLPPSLPREIPSGTPEALVHRLAAVRQRAQRSGLIGGKSKLHSAAAFQPFSPPADTIAVRLATLIDWIQEQFKAQYACLADSKGESLTGDSLPAGLAAATSLHAEALHRASTDIGFESSDAVYSGLDNGQVFTVIPAPTSEGLFSIAVVRAAPLSRRDVIRCRDGFYAAIDAQHRSLQDKEFS